MILLVPFIIALVLAVFLVLIIKKPDLFKKILSKLKKTDDPSPSDQPPPSYLDSEKSLTEKFLEAEIGDFISFGINPFTVSGTKDFPLEGKGTYYCLSHQRDDFRRKGGEYLFFGFGKDMFFIYRPDGWYGFNKSIILRGDEANAFNEAGMVFSQSGQIPRSHLFAWKGINLSVLDVGYLEYQHLAGRSHLQSGSMIKYMLAEEEQKDGQNTIYFLENLKGETGTDRVWVGQYFGMDLDSQIVDIFPRGK